MRVIIIEDERPAAEHLTYLLHKTGRKIDIVDYIDTVRDSVKKLPDLNADLIFLDIHLADDISFRIFEQLNIITPVIFTTAYDQYAIKAFQLNSIDYLLKPVEPKKLELAIQKFETIKNMYGPSQELMQQLIGQFSGAKNYKKRFLIESGRKIRSVKTSEIAFFFSAEKNTFFTTFNNKSFPTDFSLDKLEMMLDPCHFFRVSRKWIIHIDAIENIYYLSSSKIKIELTPPTDDDVVVSIRRIKSFKEWLEQ